MLRDPSEAAWHWQTSKTEHSAASSSAGSGFGGGSHDARVPQRGDAVCAAEHLDVVELTLKNDLYQTYRPIGRGGSVATTSEPDPRRVPDIGAARGGLATNSTPDLQLALAGFRAEGARHGFGGRHEPPSIPEDVQQPDALCFPPVPDHSPLPGQLSGGVPGSSSSMWDAALGFARAATAPEPQHGGKRTGGRGGGGGGAKRSAIVAQHGHSEAHPSVKAAHVVDSAQTLARSGSGLSRWASSLSLGTGTRRDSKKAQQLHQQQQQQNHHHHQQVQRQQQELPLGIIALQERQRSSPMPGSIASQERQRSGSMLTGLFGRFGKSVAAAPASFLVPALSSSPSAGRSPVASSATGSPPQQPSSPVASAASVTEDDSHLRPLRRSVSEPLRMPFAAAEADAARLLALEQSMPAMDIDTADANIASTSRQSRDKVRRSADVRMRADIHSEPPPDREYRRRNAFALEDVEDEFVNSELAQRSSIFNEGLYQVPSTSRPRRSNAQRGSEWA